MKNFGVPQYGGSVVTIECVDWSLKSALDINPYDNYTIPDFASTANLLAANYSTFTNTQLASVELNSVIHTIDQLKIELNGNSYIENFGGGGKGIVNIQGALRLNFENEVYEKNGENCNETYDFYRRVTG